MSTLSRAEARRLAGSTLVVGFDGTYPSDALLARVSSGEVAGVILFRRNVQSTSQVRSLARGLAAASTPPPIVAIDQEGGRVARLRDGVLPLPPMRALGDRDDLDLTRDAARTLGEDLAALGINLNFAPVCDVDSNPANPVIGDRAFGRVPDAVSRHARAFIVGMQSAGVAACAKHFPGHGDTATDSHLELPSLRHDRARLDAVELPPFRAAVDAGVATIMTAHVRFEAIDPERPATLSSKVLGELLRGGLLAGRGDVAVVSDDLLMKAVSARWPVERAAVLAVEAGCDMLLVCDDEAAQHRCLEALADEARRAPAFAARLGEAAGRVDSLRRRWPSRALANDDALEAFLRRGARRGVEDALASRAPAEAGRDPTER
ncbi:MAG: beta-N-acetylhexosaminidase [Polyangiales bacterium]